MPYSKDTDPYSYITAQEFFKRLDTTADNGFQRIETVRLHEASNSADTCHHGGAFWVNNDSKILIIDFVRPTSFRLRFSPTYSDINEIWDNNSHGLVSSTMKNLITVLDEFEGKNWEVECQEVENSDWVVLESRPLKKAAESINEPKEPYYMRIYVRKTRFKIVAVQPIPVRNTRDDIYLREFARFPISTESTSKFDWYPDVDSPPKHIKVVWQTKVNGMLYSKMATVIEVHKPSMARYLGFGEQGGRQLLKSRVILDYFNYDNMTYSQVHGQGPLDAREPLYHSEPYWMEIRQHPEHMLKVASFVDNFSQVCLDIGTKDNSMIRVACRFNSMRFFVIAEESISKIVNTYTLIVGRPQLKPRYVLGYHQGCYGYDSSNKIKAVVRGYRDGHEKFPLDGIHIDVDIQRNYKTFTVDGEKFSENIFDELRKDYHVKCSTNITPFISGDEDDNPTLKSGLEGPDPKFIKDRRFWKAGEEKPEASEEVYMYYDGGQQQYVHPGRTVQQAPRNLYDPPDLKPLSDTYDKNPPEFFRGGVWYGGKLGRPGYYPDLNREDVRVWWGEQYDKLIKLGLEFVWQDMTSPCMGICYGDMRSFPFRLKLTADTVKGKNPIDYPAIRIWSLYGLNLHRATFRGWDRHEKRENKRNLIIGRGGYIGLHRYAGLWTGDNSSDWDFLRVSVAQVLSLGLSGITISGGDVGGFEPGRDGGRWASPELLMRWYCAYALLPWFRNHYNAKEGKKLFQEPFKFSDSTYKLKAPEHERWLYDQVQPVCLYYVKLRYSFLQLLYDQMFNNLWTGLPIARALVISFPEDSSLVGENAEFLDTEYTVGDDLLVAPVLEPKGTRTVYLPRPTAWWQCNLQAEGPDKATELLSCHEFNGGSLIEYDAHMHRGGKDLSFITPMFIRFGGIIPQTEPGLYAEDWKPISLHIYPGHVNADRSYAMYVDDGLSAWSAPTIQTIQSSLIREGEIPPSLTGELWDEVKDDGAFSSSKARDVFWKFEISHVTNYSSSELKISRNIKFKPKHRAEPKPPSEPKPEPKPDPDSGERLLDSTSGIWCRLIIWGEPKRKEAFKKAEFSGRSDSFEKGSSWPTKDQNGPIRVRYEPDQNAWHVLLDLREEHDFTVSYASSM